MIKVVVPIFFVFVSVVICTPLVINSAQHAAGTAQPATNTACSSMSDIIPSHIENCIDKMLAICSGSTVCYKYNDLVSAVPCIVANTGIIGLFKINQCKDDLGFAQMQGLDVCIEETVLRRIFSCIKI